MAVDRLAELGISSEFSAVPGPSGGSIGGGGSVAIQVPDIDPDLAAYAKQYDPIKSALDTIERNAARVEELKEKDNKTANERARKEIMDELDRILSETNAIGTKVKMTLDKINQENLALEKKEGNSARTQMRKNLYQTYIRKFHQVMQESNRSSHDFKKNLQDRTRRQLKYVDNKMSDADVERIVESGKANEVIKQALISENLADVVREIEDRHLEILKLEQQVLEVYELFRDLATLVDLQQEHLDIIENRIQSAAAHVAKGEENLKEAKKHQEKARKKRMMILFCCLGILAIILIPTILQVLGSL